MKRLLFKLPLAIGLLTGAAVSSLGHAASADALAKPDAARGEQLYMQGDAARGVMACVTCHGAAGNSTVEANPGLAGQAHEYLAKQLHDFKAADGKEAVRTGPQKSPSVMTAVAAPLTDQDIQDVSLYLATQPVTQQAASASESSKARGEQVWRGGVADRGVPACASCHGARGEGIPGQYPRLAGQFPSYLHAQLLLFRGGDRAHGQAMQQIADRMSDEDIAAVADYAAGLR